mmetsp:Transcript_22069/g.55645  ORF Transcript_22069/g.55645 Transcript_22069/m.55645 type:complete len:550 (+) Transcript_22069:533-2182(+)
MSLSTGTPRRPYSQASQFGVSSLHEHFAEQRKQGKCDTYILFSNRHELPVRVCWVAASDPRSGAVTSEREFFTLEPGCERVMWTWCGHVWLLRSVNKEDADSAQSDILCETTAAAKPTVCRVPEAAFLRILKENKGNSFVKFVNEHGGPVRILWRDRRGEEKQYAELASGQEYVQYTWVGHEWVVRDRPSAKNDEQERRRDDGILVELTAGPEPLTVVIPPRNPFLKCNSTASLQDEEPSDVDETGSLADVRSVVSSPKSAAASPSCPIEGYAPIALRHLEKSLEWDHVFDVYCDPVAGGKKHDPFDHVRGSLVENLLLDLHEVKKILQASQTFRKMLQIVEEENQYYNGSRKDESDLRLQDEGDVVEDKVKSTALLLRSNFERFGRIFVNETYTYPEGKNNGKSCAKGVCCHWAGGWLLSNGNDPGKAGCVEVYQRQNYLGWRKEQPAILFHELSHAFHWQCQQNFGKLCSKKEDRDWFLSLDAAIKNTYEKVKATGKYEKVKYIYGQYQRHYALTTPNEYFAELCEAFCSNKRSLSIVIRKSIPGSG